MPQKDHFAVLVTIAKYPGLSDLQGPEPDGDALKAWLTSSDGGDLPPGNVFHIKSSSFPATTDPYDAKPTEIQLKKVLDHLLHEEQDEDGERPWKDRAGERLYLYFAGHGFTSGSSLSDPALFSAVAQASDTAHIAGYRYAAKIAAAGFFKEILLFMDCCQDVLKSSQVLEPTWIPPDRQCSHQVKLLQAIGAPRGKKAFERDLDNNGTTRGLFTVVLLDALRTAMPNNEGWVCGYELKKQFTQIWGKRFREETRYDPPVRLPDGEDIRILRRAPPQPDPAAHPPIPASTRIHVNISKMIPMSQPDFTVRREGRDWDFTETLRADTTKHNLPTGVFSVETDGDQNDFAFEVLPSEGTEQIGHIEFYEIPAAFPAVQPETCFQVTVHAGNEAIGLRILDADYNALVSGDGTVECRLEPGIYKVELIAGSVRRQKLFRVVDRPLTLSLPAPEFPTAAPVLGSSTSHEYQAAPAYELANRNTESAIADSDAELMVFVRASQPEFGSGIAHPNPWENLKLHRFSSAPEEWSVPLNEVNEQGLYAATKVGVRAGSYALVIPVGGTGDDQELGLAIDTLPGWRTEVYIDAIMIPPDESGLTEPLARADFARAAIHLVKIGTPSLVFDRLGTLTELQRIRLAEGVAPLVPTQADVARSPMLAVHAAYASWQQDPNDVQTIAQYLDILPMEVRVLPDVRLLESWLHPDNETTALRPWDIPLLAGAWDLSRQLPPARQLAPALRGLLGQWRSSGSLWTIWQRPLWTTDARGDTSLNYRAEIAGASRAPGNGPVHLQPGWNLDAWHAQHERMRVPAIGITPFQQALRRRLLDALDEQEQLTEEDIFGLGAQYDLDRQWIAQEYRDYYLRCGVVGAHQETHSDGGDQQFFAD